MPLEIHRYMGPNDFNAGIADSRLARWRPILDTDIGRFMKGVVRRWARIAHSDEFVYYARDAISKVVVALLHFGIGKDGMEIKHLVVVDEAHGRRIGTVMLDLARRLLRPFHRIVRLYSVDDAVEFYERYGFNRVRAGDYEMTLNLFKRKRGVF